MRPDKRTVAAKISLRNVSNITLLVSEKMRYFLSLKRTMGKKNRPPYIVSLAHEKLAQATRSGSDEKLAQYFDFDLVAKFRNLRIRLDVLKPGTRTSSPHAHTDTDEFVLVLSGSPDVWIDGDLHRLQQGEAVCFESGTGVAHTFINNTKKEVRMLAVADVDDLDKTFYPLKPEPLDKEDSDGLELVRAWFDKKLGPHNGLPNPIEKTGRNKKKKSSLPR